MDENKNPTQTQREKKTGSQTDAASNITSRRAFSKRWVYPAIYLGAAALIIGLMYIKSQSNGAPTMATSDSGNGGTTPTVSTESFISPVKAGEAAKQTVGFFPVQGNNTQQAQALVLYDNTWYPHQGIDLQPTTGKALDVVAAASGTVTNVTTKDPVYGQSIEVTSADGYTERYESLGSINVKQGDQVSQGDVLGTSGTCQFESTQGNHVYFEVDKNGQAVNPATVLPSN